MIGRAKNAGRAQSLGAVGLKHYKTLFGASPRASRTDRQLVVMVPKRNGNMMEWNTYHTIEEATAVASRLQEVGCAAWVKDLRDAPDDQPSTRVAGGDGRLSIEAPA